MHHLALAVGDQERARHFYETYCGFGSPRRYPDGTLMLYDEDGFSLALGGEGFVPHHGVGLDHADDVRAMTQRFLADGVEIVEQWDEPDYVSVKVRDPDGHIVEFSWETT